MIKVFACSDQHFFHRNIIKYANRPFDITDENCTIDNAKLIIERHNSVVTDTDYVLMLGDLSASLRGRTDLLKDILLMLNGKKILIKGNHDHLDDLFYLDAGFLAVTEYIIAGDYFINHYPCYKSEWNKGREPWLINQLNKSNCTKILHGHIHNKDPSIWIPDGYLRTNVCVDFVPNDYYPIELTSNAIKDYVVANYE